jgi:prepilin-type N-terminal cleavage/methylation domain-containing protein
MIHSLQQPPGKHHSAGYTLIEMLIASVLVAALMSTVWGLLAMYNSWLTAGRTQAEQRQLIRSLTERLTADLHILTLPDSGRTIKFLSSPTDSLTAEPIIEPSPTTDSEILMDPLTQSMEPSAEAIPDPLTWLQSLQLPTDPATPLNISLFGTQSRLRLVLPPDADQSPQFPGSYTTPGGPSVVIWEFIPWGSAGQTNLPLSSGLTRLEWNHQTFRNLTASLIGSTATAATVENSSPQPQQPRIDAIPEAVAVVFEYFDGRTWQPAWNSDAQATLPAAVRIRMHVVSPPDAETLSLRFPAKPPTEPTPQTIPEPVPEPESESTNLNLAASPPLKLHTIEHIVLLQPITGAMPGLTDPDAELPGAFP